MMDMHGAGASSARPCRAYGGDRPWVRDGTLFLEFSLGSGRVAGAVVSDFAGGFPRAKSFTQFRHYAFT